MDGTTQQLGSALGGPLLECLVQALPFALLIVDAEGGIRFANAGAEVLFGYATAELVGSSIDRLVPHEARGIHGARRQSFLDDPRPRLMGTGRDLNAVRKDGSAIAVEVALAQLVAGKEKFTVAIIVDTTLRRQLEAQLRRAQRELEQRVEERTAALEQANREKELLLADLEAKRRELERLSREDALTGLSNRRDFDLRLADLVTSAQQDGEALCVAMFDLDHFKRVNDTCGHATGDAVLVQTARLLRRECRGPDLVARYGGEEFALAFPRSSLDDAQRICERIRRSFEQFDWSKIAPGLSLTISSGVAAWQRGMESADALARADENLYIAKRAGRNRVHVA
jgi:diguanylate cyclase (GGDEF)-like protein/PAS domain S-box-containing protein